MQMGQVIMLKIDLDKKLWFAPINNIHFKI